MTVRRRRRTDAEMLADARELLLDVSGALRSEDPRYVRLVELVVEISIASDMPKGGDV